MLKLSSGGWNEELIKASFFQVEAELILSLPCSSPFTADSIMWHYEKWGSFSVKSGYNFGCNVWSNPSSSGLNPTVSWWKFLWRMQIPSKVKLFIWHACNNWIPSWYNLLRRKVPINSGFPLYDWRTESTMHALWCCPLLRPLVQEELELFCLVLWRGWYSRNCDMHGVSKLYYEKVFSWARAFHEDYRRANNVPKVTKINNRLNDSV
ncbi:hypothetical protein QYF36_007708 [Acer negundo]|nr:hypothetical protein QYF36_007708 [Acer negundo]